MKKFILLIICLLPAFFTFSQSPDAFKYQASLKDASGKPLANQNLNVTISILQGSISGPSIYLETHTILSDVSGTINLEIGKGNTVGNFSNINWSLGNFFLKISVNGNEMGVSQLLTVPYSKYADKAGNVFSGNYNDLSNLPNFTNWDKNVSDDFSGQYSDLIGTPDFADTANYIRINNPQAGDIVFYNGTEWQVLPKGNNDQTLMLENGLPVWKNNSFEISTNYIGKFFEEGIIFYVSPDGQHGLIASLFDVDGGTGVAWSSITSSESGASSWYNGSLNTETIVAQGAASSAAQLCKSLGNEWYLPSAWELNLLYDRIYEINQALDNDSDPNTYGLQISSSSPEGRYWSSTENGLNNAWSFTINFGTAANSNKNANCRVRAIKAF